MMEALAAIGGIGTLGLATAVVVLAFKLFGSKDDQLGLRDLLDAERAQHRATRSDLELETAAHAETRRLLAKEKDLRAVAESQRNQAFQQARDYFVALLKKSKIADVDRLTAELLAAPLPGFVPPTVPEGRATAPGPDALIDPFAVQPAGDPSADR